jgi:hypothetical protein
LHCFSHFITFCVSQKKNHAGLYVGEGFEDRNTVIKDHKCGIWLSN